MKLPYILTRRYAQKKKQIKNAIGVVAITLLVLSLVGCGETEHAGKKPEETPTQESTNENNESSETDKPYDNSSLDGILEGINADYEKTTQYITAEFEKVKSTIGTYEEYIEQKQVLTDWYELLISESSLFFQRTDEKAKDYYRLIVTSIDHKKDGAIDDAMEALYDGVYSGVYDDYYDDVIDDLLDDVYDEYYSGIIDDAYDYVEYNKWSEVSGDCYEMWSDYSSDCYDLWSNASSNVYDLWSDISSAFWNNNFDIEDILEGKVDSSTEDDSQEAEVTDSSDEGVSPEFKAAMDSYEAFFDEYIEFMKKYAESDELMSMLTDNMDYLSRYTDTMQKLSEINQDDLSIGDALYYTDVMLRINEKLTELAY